MLRSSSRWRRAAARACSRILAPLLALLVASCARGTPPLRVGLPAWVPTEFAFVARDLGYFDDQEVELVEYSSPIELSRHLRDGSLDAAALTLDFAPYWAASIPSLDVVFVIDVSNGADGVVAIPEIHDLAGLRGRRIGVEASPLGAHMLLRALKAGGLPRRDVETVSLDSEDHVDAFLSHRIDAVVTCEPDRTRLLSSGATSLFDSTRTPGQVVHVLIIRSATAAEHQQALRKLVDGWLAAFTKLKDDRATILRRLASGLSLDVGTVERVLAGVRLADLAMNRDLLGGSSPRLASTLKEIESVAIDGGLLRADTRRVVRFDDSYLPGVVARRVGELSGVEAR